MNRKMIVREPLENFITVRLWAVLIAERNFQGFTILVAGWKGNTYGKD